ncbi:MAG: DUF3667 domain-containing protein [Pseudomonadota bacterium]
MHCNNCGFELRATDHYCPNCGQSVTSGRDRSFAHLMRASFVEVASVDSRLWRSLRALFSKPGFLSREYQLGRRRRFLSPIGIFLLANLLYFLAPPISDLQLTLEQQYKLQFYRGWITGWVDGYIADTGSTFEAVARHYELRIAELAKLMVILHVPLLALFSMLAFIDKRLYYADHVVIAFHYFAFLMLYLITTSAIVYTAFWAAPALVRLTMPYLATIVVLAQFLYVPPMLKRAMAVPWWRAILMTPLFVAGLFVAHTLYRFIQFVVGFSLVTLS